MTLSRSGQIAQPVHGDVVADVDDGRHLIAGLPGDRPDAEKEARAADAAGEDHDPHATILPHGYDKTAWAGRPASYAGVAARD